jgi:hypothetical protein|tara:strand:- start:17 stop:358 length:342 start_codon:yes stop_codon:yes gene_type:complete
MGEVIDFRTQKPTATYTADQIRIVPLSEKMKPTKDPDNTVWWGITLFTEYDHGRRESNNLALYQARLVAAYESMSYAVRGALVMAHDLNVPIDSDQDFLIESDILEKMIKETE